MPQSVAKILNAPLAPPKNLPTPAPPKTTHPAESSFHATLSQIKNKTKSPAAAHKAPVAGKPQAHKPLPSSKKAKPTSTKPTAPKTPQPSAGKSQPDDITEESPHESLAHPHDPASDAPQDPSADADS